MMIRHIGLCILIFVFGTLCIPLQIKAVRNVLSPGVFSSARIEGIVGQKMNNCVANGVMAKKYDLYSINKFVKLRNYIST